MDSPNFTHSQLQQATNRLKNAEIPSPQRDITAILSVLFHVPRHRAITGDFHLNPKQWTKFHQLIGRRAKREPLQYILGKCNFWKQAFRITPAVLIPRPETEHLVEAALNTLPPDREKLLVDCCTGSGCVAVSIALERPALQAIGCDISTEALKIAQENRERLKAFNCQFLASDMLAAFAPDSVDFITANPPYVSEEDAASLQPELSFEPEDALYSTGKGLEHLSKLLIQAPLILKKKGHIAFEFGYNQGEAVRKLVKKSSSRPVLRFEIIKDLGGHERIGLIQYA